MGTPAQPSTYTTTRTSAMHNASVDEAAAMQGECAQVHLPTGRRCTLPHGHPGSCEFIWADLVGLRREPLARRHQLT